jgi:hypothetical protein
MSGNAAVLPKFVPLGESEFESEYEPESDLERTILLTRMLSESGENFGHMLPVASDLIRMMNYLETEGKNPADIDWTELVTEKYAKHFSEKARFLNIASRALPVILKGATAAQKRNDDIRRWVDNLNGYSKVIVCGSTGSIPATSDLMEHVTRLSNGMIILPGKLGVRSEELGVSDPYYLIGEFLEKINCNSIAEINTGSSSVELLNLAFNNLTPHSSLLTPHFNSHFVRIDCDRESEEAEAIAVIAADAVNKGQSVLIVTPDVAANQRISVALDERGIHADSSFGLSGTMSQFGRYILNELDSLYTPHSTLHTFLEQSELTFPEIELPAIQAVKDLSDILTKYEIALGLADLQAAVAYALSFASVRPPLQDDAKITILGTMESRMQTADVVILSGLNEGMFPALGFSHPWLPKATAESIGLPPAERKVSLMALDFISLSCGKKVYWTRSKTAGGANTSESRFLSRMSVAARDAIVNGDDILKIVRSFDDVPMVNIKKKWPAPPAVKNDVWATDLDLLVNNPYAFYVKNILGLKKIDDPWEDKTARDFGNLVHEVIEIAAGKTADQIRSELHAKAAAKTSDKSVLFEFWKKRFDEIVPLIAEFINGSPDGIAEIEGRANIAGRNVRARADRIWPGYVADIKTGNIPNKKQLMSGTAPQLPIEALMMQRGGFPNIRGAGAVAMQFLQLRGNDCKIVEYNGSDAAEMIAAAEQKISGLFGRYNNDYETYEHMETNGPKYKMYDDLARVWEE